MPFLLYAIFIYFRLSLSQYGVCWHTTSETEEVLQGTSVTRRRRAALAGSPKCSYALCLKHHTQGLNNGLKIVRKDGMKKQKTGSSLFASANALAFLPSICVQRVKAVKRWSRATSGQITSNRQKTSGIHPLEKKVINCVLKQSKECLPMQKRNMA